MSAEDIKGLRFSTIKEIDAEIARLQKIVEDNRSLARPPKGTELGAEHMRAKELFGSATQAIERLIKQRENLPEVVRISDYKSVLFETKSNARYCIWRNADGLYFIQQVLSPSPGAQKGIELDPKYKPVLLKPDVVLTKNQPFSYGSGGYTTPIQEFILEPDIVLP